MTARTAETLDRIAYLAFAGALCLIQLTIVGGEALLDIALLAWLALAIGDRRRPATPAFFLPLVVLAGWTLVSTAFSSDVLHSLREDKQLFWYLIVPVAMRVAGARRATTITHAIIAVGAVGALVGIVQGAVINYDDLIHHRPHGLLGHYMTYSGVLMLVICAAAAQLIYRDREWLWPAVAVPSLLAAIAFTLSRNAWVGALLAIAVLIGLRRRVFLIVVPAIVAVALLLGPVRERALSMFDPANATNMDRVSMLKSGMAMIADHPIVGVGPNMVPQAYLEHYKRADAVDPADQPGSTRAHLHNVVVQLAAERGLPALAAWLWFLVVAVRDLWRLFRRGRARALAGAGLAAVAAMAVAGLFEHNFGDSEFLILFLGLITLPFAAVGPTGDAVERGAERAA